MRLEIKEQPFVTPSGKELDGIEKIVECPLWLCKVNVRKVCSKCLKRVYINYKENYVECRYKKS